MGIPSHCLLGIVKRKACAGLRKLTTVSTDRPATYGYEQLADRIEAVLGERPSASSLRAARAEARRWETRRIGARRVRPGLTTGMPAPLPAASRTAPARFDAEQVEIWLAHHPAHAWEQAIARTRERLASGDEITGVVVADALRAGLSWSVLTDLINERTVADGGRARTRAAIHYRYRHVDPDQ